MLGKCHSGEWLAGLTAPVGVALLLIFFLGGTDPASPPYRTQRVVFAWPFEVPVADPIRGQSSTDLSDRRSFVARYRLRRPCVYPAVPGCKISRWRLDGLSPCAALFAAWVNCKPFCTHLHNYLKIYFLFRCFLAHHHHEKPSTLHTP